MSKHILLLCSWKGNGGQVEFLRVKNVNFSSLMSPMRTAQVHVSSHKTPWSTRGKIPLELLSVSTIFSHYLYINSGVNCTGQPSQRRKINVWSRCSKSTECQNDLPATSCTVLWAQPTRIMHQIIEPNNGQSPQTKCKHWNISVEIHLATEDLEETACRNLSSIPLSSMVLLLLISKHPACQYNNCSKWINNIMYVTCPGCHLSL